MSILLITDTQLGMALKNVNSKQWSPKILKWSGEFAPSEKELNNLNKLKTEMLFVFVMELQL